MYICVLKGGDSMYLVYKCQLKHLTKAQYLILRDLCRTAKNLKNQAIYEVL